MLDEIRAKRDEIYAIARRHKAEKLWVFGSCARKEERPDSDVDFLVKWMPGEYSWRNECAMSSAYEKLLGSRIDLVSSPLAGGFFTPGSRGKSKKRKKQLRKEET